MALVLGLLSWAGRSSVEMGPILSRPNPRIFIRPQHYPRRYCAAKALDNILCIVGVKKSTRKNRSNHFGEPGVQLFIVSLAAIISSIAMTIIPNLCRERRQKNGDQIVFLCYNAISFFRSFCSGRKPTCISSEDHGGAGCRRWHLKMSRLR